MTITAEAGANVARTEGCDVVLALGGGSIIDAAKGIAFLVKNRGDVNDYILNRQTGTEAYLSNKGKPMTDMMALQGIELTGKHLVNVYENPDGMEGWEAVSWASTHGGNDENDCIEVIRKLLERLSLNITLSEQGIKNEDISWMVENCQKVGSANISNAPRKYTEEVIVYKYDVI